MSHAILMRLNLWQMSAKSKTQSVEGSRPLNLNPSYHSGVGVPDSNLKQKHHVFNHHHHITPFLRPALHGRDWQFECRFFVMQCRPFFLLNLTKTGFILSTAQHRQHGITCYHTSAASVIQRYHLYHWHEHQVHMMAYNGIRGQVTWTFKISASPHDIVLRQ